jgi:hypothetical protein
MGKRNILIGAILAAALVFGPLAKSAVAEAGEEWKVPSSGAPDGPAFVAPLPRGEATFDYDAVLTRTFEDYGPFVASEPLLEDRVLNLELDPKAAFELVRDGVASLPYNGTLRSPEEVFAAQSGNAYDKAATLVYLLTRMGFDTRLVTSETPSPMPSLPVCNEGGLDENVWALTKLDPAAPARIRARAEAGYSALRPFLAPTDLPADPRTPHVWVQMRDGADWVDLDPWLASTQWGEHPLGEGRAMSDLPQPQSVTVTVTLETLRNGVLQRDELLSRRLEMPDAATSFVALTFGPKAAGTGGVVADALSAIEGQTGSIVASLRIDDESFTSRSFVVPGTVEGTEIFSEGEALVTTGVWLTITSAVPGGADHSEIRTIVDLVPQALRANAAQAPIMPADLMPAIMGDRYPAALESLRQIVVSNGGMSPRLIAAFSVMQMAEIPELLERIDTGSTDVWDLLWPTMLEARRVALAAEELIRARPRSNGACAVIDRPRAMIWGVSAAGGEEAFRWLDWTLDDIAILGGDATAQAEARLWHGVVQAGLEKEALLWLMRLEDHIVPLDKGPMMTVDGARRAALGVELKEDEARGYLTLADAATLPDMWWRLDPESGRADARARYDGNTYGLRDLLRRGSIGSGRPGGVYRVPSAAQQNAINKAAADIQRAKRLERARPKKSSATLTGYVELMSNVSIPISVGAGSVVAEIVIIGVYYAFIYT